MSTNAFNLVIKEIEEKRESIARALIEGSAKDYAEYKSMTGEIRGLSLAHAYVSDLLRKMENDE
jgi:hypothetical protein